MSGQNFPSIFLLGCNSLQQTEKCITSNFVHQAEQQSSSHDILQGHLFGMLYLGSGFL